jgi:hypothetical protein
VLWKPEPLKWIAGGVSTRAAAAPHSSHLVSGSSVIFWIASKTWPFSHLYS